MQPHQPEAAVRFDAVTVQVGRRLVLTDVTALFERGTVTRLVGANGSGKSTALRLAAGVIRPTRGRVLRTVEGVAYVPERGELGGALTVADYLDHMSRLTSRRGGTQANTDGLDPARTLDLIVDRYGLAPCTGVPVRTLSKGTQRKVAVVQALLTPADLLVLDEPSDGLDRQAVEALREDITAAARGGVAVLLTCHSDDLDDLPVPTACYRVATGRLTPAGRDDPSRREHPDGWPSAVIVQTWRDGTLRSERVDASDLPGYLTRALAAGERVHRVDPGPDWVDPARTHHDPVVGDEPHGSSA